MSTNSTTSAGQTIIKEEEHLFNTEGYTFSKKDFEKKELPLILEELEKKDPLLKTIFHNESPFAIAPNRNRFDFFVDAIIAQQVSNKSALTVSRRFRAEFLPKKPSPSLFLSKTKETFSKRGISPQKYDCIKSLALFLENKKLSLSQLEKQSDQKIRECLLQIKGIGDWTVDMILLFALKRLDIFPTKDLILKKKISQLYGISLHNTIAMRKISEKWQPYRGIVSWYLYKKTF